MTYLHLDAIENGRNGHVFHLDDYLVRLEHGGLVVTVRS
jgi:hypothetical protein